MPVGQTQTPGPTPPEIPVREVRPGVPGPTAGEHASASPWFLWLGWAWVGILVLAAVAEIFHLDGLRLALDFRRHLR